MLYRPRKLTVKVLYTFYCQNFQYAFFLQYLSGNYINIGLSLEILEREFSLESYFSLGALVFSSLPLVSSPSPVWTRGMPLFLPPGEWISLPTSG